MVLYLEYFKNQMHVSDLQKLNERELKPIIHLLEDVLENFRINDGFETKDIIKTCDEALDLFKDFNFILFGYIRVIGINDLSFCDRTTTECLISNIDTIITDFKHLRSVGGSINKIIDDGNDCLRELQAFYNSMNEYIIDEYNIWEKEESENS